MTPTEAAWFAGILDGEGSFMVLYERRYGYERWEACVGVTSTDDRIVERCKALAGGKLSRQVSPGGNARLARVWQLKGKRVSPLIEAVFPYLLTKLDQATLLLVLRSETRAGALPGNCGVHSATSDTRHRRQSIRLAVQALNHRGTTAIPEDRLDGLAWATQHILSRTAAPLN